MKRIKKLKKEIVICPVGLGLLTHVRTPINTNRHKMAHPALMNEQVDIKNTIE